MNNEMSIHHLTGAQKAAILLMELGVESSVEVTRRLANDSLPSLAKEMASLASITDAQRKAVKEEFLASMARPQAPVAADGREFAQEMLRRTVKHDPFRALDFLQTVDRTQLLDIVRHEHPQVIAFILAYLQPEQASGLMAGLPRDVQSGMALRIATMQSPHTDALVQLNHVLAARLNPSEGGRPKVGGLKQLMQILRSAGRNTERVVLDAFREQRPDLVENARSMMLVFEDMARLDDVSCQKILKQIDGRTLTLALKRAPDEIKELVMRNLSERAASILKSDLEGMERVRVSEVEQAQQAIVECLRDLEGKGEIKILEEDEEMI